MTVEVFLPDDFTTFKSNIKIFQLHFLYNYLKTFKTFFFFFSEVS